MSEKNEKRKNRPHFSLPWGSRKSGKSKGDENSKGVAAFSSPDNTPITNRVATDTGRSHSSLKSSEASIKSSESLTSLPRSPLPSPSPSSRSQPLATPTFWERAYNQLSNDQEKLTLIEDYDRVLQASKQKGKESEKKTSEDAPLLPNASQFRVFGKEMEMKTLAQQKLEDSQRREWILRWKGRDVFNVRKKVTQIKGVIEHFSGLIGAAAKLDPMHAGLAWSGVCVMLSLVVADSEEREKAIEGLSIVTSITARYSVSESDYLKGHLGNNHEFEEMLVHLYVLLLTFYAKVACYFAHHTLTIVLRNIVKQDDWTTALNDIHRADEECKDFIAKLTGSSLLAGQYEAEKKLGSLVVFAEDERVKDILQWTSLVDVGEQHLKVKEKLGAKYSNSGGWLLQSDEIESWSKGRRRDFWLKGAVGTGKSSLVSLLIDQVKPLFTNLAWFYCNAGITDWMLNPLLVIARALISQLALSPDGKSVAEELKNLYAEAINHGRNGSQLNSEQSWQLLLALIESRDSTVIIIDALDKCPKPAELLSRLRDLSKSCPKLNLFFSSQAVVSVEEYFPDIKTTTITASKNSDDIAAFVKGEVEHFEEIRPGLLGANLTQDIIDTLSTHAEAMFIWAQLCLQLIVDPEGDDSADEIKNIWALVKPQPNQSLLEQLIIMYDKLYLKHLPTSSAKTQAMEKKTERLLKWTLCSIRPLKSSEILSIISGRFEQLEQPSPTQNYLPKSCRSFVFESESQEIEIAHSSVRDYLALKFSHKLEDYRRSSTHDREQILWEAHRDSLLQCNIQISTDCLSCLLSTNGPVIRSKLSPRPQLYHYAAENWIGHVKTASSENVIPNAVFQPLLKVFSKDNFSAFQNWLFISNPEYEHCDDAALSVNPEPLYYAIPIGLSSLVREMLAQGNIDVNSSGGLYGSCLQLAAFLGNAEVVEELILRGAKVDMSGGIFGSALQAAAAGGHSSIVSSLLQNPLVHPSATGGLLGNALQAALARGADEVVSLLVAHGVTMNPNGGRLWKAAYDGLNPSRKQLILQIMISATKLPHLTDLQASLAYTIRFSSEPDTLRNYAFLKRKDYLKPTDVEFILQNCQLGDLDDVGFLYQILPSIVLARIIDESPKRDRLSRQYAGAYVSIPRIIREHYFLEHSKENSAIIFELEFELIELYSLIFRIVIEMFHARPSPWLFFMWGSRRHKSHTSSKEIQRRHDRIMRELAMKLRFRLQSAELRERVVQLEEENAELRSKMAELK